MELAQMSDVGAADAMLRAAEAAETGVQAPVQTQVDTPPETTAGKTSEVVTETPNSDSTGIPAAAEKQSSTKTEPKTVETQKTGQGSQFSKDAVRRDTSWKALNAEKETLAKEQEQFKSQRDLFQREQQQFQQTKAKSASKYTPEQYEQAADGKSALIESYNAQADGFEARAVKLEEAGQLLEAQKATAKAGELREAAMGEKASARKLKEYATHLRANPEPTLQQIAAKNAQALKDYTLKAAQKWPELVKDGSEFQKKVAEALNSLKSEGFDVNEYPQLMYTTARLVAAETTAASVPGMTKELGELRAKVKELEKLTSPGGGQGAVQAMDGQTVKTDEQEYAELRQMAASR